VSRSATPARLAGLFLLVAALAWMTSTGSALAGITHEFQVFKNCPLENPEVTSCLYSTTESGEFKLGNKTVPINKTVVLQGGLTQTSEALVPASNGETLSHTPLQVPGGIIGIELLGPLTEVSAVAELAGTVDVNLANAVKGEGVGVKLPLRAKLENPLLGASCTVGTFTPLLTTGTTKPPFPAKPITGASGTLTMTGGGKINEFTGVSLVDNAFSVPGASGCGGLLFLLIDPSVDLIVGIPAGSGHNAAVLNGSVALTGANVVKAQLALPEIGRCVKVPSEKVEKTVVYHGLYLNAGCTEEVPQRTGKYEWEPGAVAKHFSGAGKAITLQTTGGKKVSCTGSATSGEYTGLRTASISLTLTGCQNALKKEPCQTSGGASGELNLGTFATELGFITDKMTSEGPVAKLGWDLQHGATFVSATCGGSKEALTVTGSLIAPITVVDKMATSYSLAPKAKLGVQEVRALEEGPNDSLSTTLGAGGPEPSGVNGSVKVTNPEKLEFKALSE